MITKGARKRLRDSKAKAVVVGDPDGSRGWLPMPLFGAEYLGWNVRFIVGYSGSADMILALRQGELHMIATANATLINDLVKENVVDLVTQQGKTRRSDYPDVPTFLEVLGDKRPLGIPWQAYNVWAGPSDLDKFLVMPPKTPAKIVKMLRGAFEKMVKDPEAMAVTTRFYGPSWVVTGAKQTEDLVKEVTNVSEEVKDYLRKLRKKHGLPKS
jgi:tripartite-type tricarboxylate transporter receptor subunit TctC